MKAATFSNEPMLNFNAHQAQKKLFHHRPSKTITNTQKHFIAHWIMGYDPSFFFLLVNRTVQAGSSSSLVLARYQGPHLATVVERFDEKKKL